MGWKRTFETAIAGMALALLFVSASWQGASAEEVKARVWSTPYELSDFPEIGDATLKVDYLMKRPSFGVAFSGGGTRAAAAALGQLQALTMLGWMDKVRYISAVSGGSWTAVPYTFLPDRFADRCNSKQGLSFFGAYHPAGLVSDADLEDDETSLMSIAVSKSNLVLAHGKRAPWGEDPCDPKDARSKKRIAEIKNSVTGSIQNFLNTFKGKDEFYARSVGNVFLDRFGLYDPKRSFTQHANSLASIAEANPNFAGDAKSFIKTREGRPYLIIGATLLDPIPGSLSTKVVKILKEKLRDRRDGQDDAFDLEQILEETKTLKRDFIFPFEITPLYAGIRSARARLGSSQGPVGGGYVESFAYDSVAPPALVADGTPVNKFDLEKTRNRFSLSDMIGVSGAAPQIVLASLGKDKLGFPKFRHSPIMSLANGSSQDNEESREATHGDGGHIDNLGLFPLLARKVQNILLFNNTRSGFLWECESAKRRTKAQCRADLGVPEKRIQDNVVSFFKSTDKMPHNVVFETGKLTELVTAFDRKAKAGSPLVHCFENMKIRANDRQGIREDETYRPTVCLVYLHKPKDWLDKIAANPNLSQKTKLALRDGKKPFKRFPQYWTFIQNPKQGIIDLKTEQVNALRHLTAWTIFDAAGQITRAFNANDDITPLNAPKMNLTATGRPNPF